MNPTEMVDAMMQRLRASLGMPARVPIGTWQMHARATVYRNADGALDVEWALDVQPDRVQPQDRADYAHAASVAIVPMRELLRRAFWRALLVAHERGNRVSGVSIFKRSRPVGDIANQLRAAAAGKKTYP